MSDNYQLGRDIQSIIDGVRRLEERGGQSHGRGMPCGCDKMSRGHMAHVTGAMPVEAIPAEFRERFAVSPDKLYKVQLTSYGYDPVCGLWIPSGGPLAESPLCCNINWFGTVRYAKMLNVTWMCAETFVTYWVDGIQMCA